MSNTRNDVDLHKIKSISMPTFNITLPNGTQKNIRISDQDILVKSTQLGLIVSFDVWCPINPYEQEAHMKALANYLFQLAKAGVVGIMLKNIPNNLNILNRELQLLCVTHNNKSEESLHLEFKCQERSNNTCVLINAEKIAIKNHPSKSDIPEMAAQVDCYEIYALNQTPPTKIDVYNIHGPSHAQDRMQSFIDDKLKKDAVVFSNFNAIEQKQKTDATTMFQQRPVVNQPIQHGSAKTKLRK